MVGDVAFNAPAEGFEAEYSYGFGDRSAASRNAGADVREHSRTVVGTRLARVPITG
jgi:hypothetical protein